MSTNFPTSIDALSNPSWTDSQLTVNHANQHANANDAIEALETKLWIDGSSDISSIDYKLTEIRKLSTKGDILVHTGTTYARLPVGTDGYMLVADSAQANGVKYTAPSAWGTVTTASVVSANGFAWSVANATTTPAITLSTSITGVLKGNWTALSAATAWTDYYAPWSTDVAVADGGTWVSTLTAYAPIFGGTTTTWPVQQVAVGSSGQVLTSNGAWALASFQNASYGVLYADSTESSFASSTGFQTIQAVTIPWGFLATGKLRIRMYVLTKSFGFGGWDSRDEVSFTLEYGGTTLTAVTVNPFDNVERQGWIDFLFEGTASSAQRVTATSTTFWNTANAYRGFTYARWTSAVDSTVSQTLNVKWANGFSNASVYFKKELITIEKL